MIRDIGAQRAAVATDCLDISPEDILKLALEDLATGKTKADGILIITTHRPPNQRWNLTRYRAGLARDQELVALCLSYEATIRNWMDPA